jgi:hypothetical protein
MGDRYPTIREARPGLDNEPDIASSEQQADFWQQ